MRSVEETSAALRALAKALVDNEYRTTELMRERLTAAVFKAVMEPERMPANGHNHNNGRKINANAISNRRRNHGAS